MFPNYDDLSELYRRHQDGQHLPDADLQRLADYAHGAWHAARDRVELIDDGRVVEDWEGQRNEKNVERIEWESIYTELTGSKPH
ncbi:hypothetical protein HA052_19745 [Chromobacterium haemolyticum]|uniref:Uncharacterized protein n=1 Tax=Chromobacterium fluminis TaxID=3044269 RepID=A0ABX0LEQ1_9NEIS|nr:hypothetical protein [Chromobacterium haemolyticum]NHR07428.1 hypothetical protein [Chromobacterium haemolyticum]